MTVYSIDVRLIRPANKQDLTGRLTVHVKTNTQFFRGLLLDLKYLFTSNRLNVATIRIQFAIETYSNQHHK
jgi:hypothetical protein